MRVPIILINKFITPGNFDTIGLYIADNIISDYARRYHDEILLTDNAGVIVGCIGGATAFNHLPHRAVIDNARRYGLDMPAGYTCPNCGGTRVAICHRIPRAYGGNLSPHNLYIDCSHCNARQRDVLTPGQVIALLPFYVVVDISPRAVINWVNNITSEDITNE